MRAALFVVLLGGCNALVNFGELQLVSEPEVVDGEDAGAPLADGGTTKPSGDAGARPPGCDVTKPFGTPALLDGPIQGKGTFETAPTLSDDELSIFINRLVGTESSVLVATRPSFDKPFGAPTEITSLGSKRDSAFPTTTGDGLTLFFARQVVDAQKLTVTSGEIMMSGRPTTTGAWGTPTPYRSPNDSAIQSSPHVTRDGAELYFSRSEAATVLHIYRSLRGEIGLYQPPTRVDELNSTDGSEGGIATSKDNLTMYFASSRAGSVGANDVYVARRARMDAPWGNIARVPEVSSPGLDRPGWLSPDGCRLYLASDRDGDGAIYVASKK